MADAPVRGAPRRLGHRDGRRGRRRVRRVRHGRASRVGSAAMTQSRGLPGPRSRAFVGWTLRWGKWLWLAALVIAVPATWRTAELYVHLRSEIEQLLPRSAP